MYVWFCKKPPHCLLKWPYHLVFPPARDESFYCTAPLPASGSLRFWIFRFCCFIQTITYLPVHSSIVPFSFFYIPLGLCGPALGNHFLFGWMIPSTVGWLIKVSHISFSFWNVFLFLSLLRLFFSRVLWPRWGKLAIRKLTIYHQFSTSKGWSWWINTYCVLPPQWDNFEVCAPHNCLVVPSGTEFQLPTVAKHSSAHLVFPLSVSHFFIPI